MNDQKHVLENTIKRCRERNIIIPTYDEMAHPEKIPTKIRDELKNIGLWDLNPRNMFRINWKNEPVKFGGPRCFFPFITCLQYKQREFVRQ